MNSQELRALQEAYNQVYELDEDAGIVSGLVGLALGAKGALHAAKKTKRLRDYPKNFVKGIADPRTYVPKKKKDTNEAVDLYDIILSHLLDEGYADTEQAAEAIMVNMSEDWRESIVEARMDPRGRPASGPMNVYANPKGKPDQAHLDAIKSYDEKQKKKTPEQRQAELDAYIARQRNK
jgi:hypothetical protein